MTLTSSRQRGVDFMHVGTHVKATHRGRDDGRADQPGRHYLDLRQGGHRDMCQ